MRGHIPTPRGAEAELSCARVKVPGQELQLAGRLDVHTAADVRLSLVEAVDVGSGDLVADMSEVVAIDATGLGLLVGAHRRADRAGRTLVLRDVSDPVARALFLTRLERVLHTDTSHRVA